MHYAVPLHHIAPLHSTVRKYSVVSLHCKVLSHYKVPLHQRVPLHRKVQHEGKTLYNQRRFASHSTISLTRALSFLEQLGKLQGTALFVGDRDEHARIFDAYLPQTRHSYLSCGWVPGLLTNSSQHDCLRQAHKLLSEMAKEKPKALRGRAQKIFRARHTIYANIHTIKPDVVILLGEEDYYTGVLRECHKLHIPTIALCRTPYWAAEVTYPVFFKTSIRIVHLLVKLYIAALTGESTQYTQKAKKYTTKSFQTDRSIPSKSRDESASGTSTPSGAQALSSVTTFSGAQTPYGDIISNSAKVPQDNTRVSSDPIGPLGPSSSRTVITDTNPAEK